MLSGNLFLMPVRHDSVIAIGGGAQWMVASPICLTANNNINLWAFEWEETPAVIEPRRIFSKVNNYPNTAGTGAETESTAMITHTGGV